MLCESMNCTYLDVWEEFLGSFKLYKKYGVHLNVKGVDFFLQKRMDKCLSLWQGN